jgi:hypothetical protein
MECSVDKVECFRADDLVIFISRKLLVCSVIDINLELMKTALGMGFMEIVILQV